MSDYEFLRLGPGRLPQMESALDMFGAAFDEPETYGGCRPSEPYLIRLLSQPSFIMLAAIHGDEVVGGLAAYVLEERALRPRLSKRCKRSVPRSVPMPSSSRPIRS